MRVIQPDDVVKPASSYAQAIAHKLAGERLLVSGQIGVAPDGTIEKGLEAQLARTWSNLLAVVRAAGFRREEIVKVTILVTVPGAVAASRAARDKALAGHLCASTFLQVAGLAHPDLLVEIEAEAVREA